MKKFLIIVMFDKNSDVGEGIHDAYIINAKSAKTAVEKATEVLKEELAELAGGIEEFQFTSMPLDEVQEFNAE